MSGVLYYAGKAKAGYSSFLSNHSSNYNLFIITETNRHRLMSKKRSTAGLQSNVSASDEIL